MSGFAFLSLSWLMQFLLQTLALYFSWPTVVRYLNVYNMRMILDDLISDDFALGLIRSSSAVASITICIVLHGLGKYPAIYHIYFLGENDPKVYMEAQNIVFAMVAMSLLFNLVLRILISKEGSMIGSEVHLVVVRKLKAAVLGMVVFLSVAGVFRLGLFLVYGETKDILEYNTTVLGRNS